MKWLRTGIYVFFLVICMSVGAAYNFASRVMGSLRDPGASVGDVIGSFRNPRGQFPNKDGLTILLVGQDYNHDNKGNLYTKASRADTVMLMAVDFEKGSVRACSVPRDTYVTAPDGKSGKINATFSRGGIDLLKGTLHELFNVDIDHYVVIKPHAVREIVDAVGGVEVESIDAMNYDDNWGGLHIHLPKGKQFVDGPGAEGFIRFREVNRSKMNSDGRIVPIRNVVGSKEEGDLRRTARQQQLVHALMKAATTSENLMRADQIVEVGFDQIVTDLTRIQCLALGNIVKGSAKKSMPSATVPGTDRKQDGTYYFMLDEVRARATVDWLIKGDDEAMKRTIRVAVFNGSKTTGAAKKAAEMLDAKGFMSTVGGNAPKAMLTTIVYGKALHEPVARQIQQTLGSATVSKKVGASRGPDITIVIGEDISKSFVNQKM